MDAPDILDALGLAISEVGAVQVAIESARLFWPNGEARVVVLLQAAWSGELQVELELSDGVDRVTRSVRVPAAEVRRVRLPLALPGGAAPLVLKVRAPIAEGSERIRAAWLKDATPTTKEEGVGAALFGAFRYALGKREPKPVARAPDALELKVNLVAVGGVAPLAAEEETAWSPGMPVPASAPLQELEPVPASTLVSRVDAESPRPECPSCYTRADLELVKSQRHCPSCGHVWLL